MVLEIPGLSSPQNLWVAKLLRGGYTGVRQTLDPESLDLPSHNLSANLTKTSCNKVLAKVFFFKEVQGLIRRNKFF